jgi:aconitate hydratase
LIGVEDAFLPAQPRGIVNDIVTGKLMPLLEAATNLQKFGLKWCIIGHNNYREGSSRRHAAIEPEYLSAVLIIANNFARVHETNMKK